MEIKIMSENQIEIPEIFWIFLGGGIFMFLLLIGFASLAKG